MEIADILPQTLHPAPAFLCENLRTADSPIRYRVPLCHRTLKTVMTDRFDKSAGKQAFEAIASNHAASQLCSLVADGLGHGLLVSQKLYKHRLWLRSGTQAAQAVLGSVIVFPPHEWEAVKTEMLDWFFDGVEEGCKGLPYTAKYIIPFAGVNFSPDRWYLVLRGPMAGNVCWWTHDGDSVMSEPWAVDLKAWGKRLWDELPEVLGGVIRFGPKSSLDNSPEDAELYPLEYVSDLNVK